MNARALVPLLCLFTLGGVAAKAADTFDDLVKSVSRQPPPEALSPAEAARLAYCVSQAAITTRKTEVLDKAGVIRLDKKPSGKQSLRVVLARLQRDPKDAAAWENVIQVAPFAGKSAHFTKIMLAFLYGQYHAALSPAVTAALRSQMEAYDEFMGTGTENHIAMQRISAAIFGAAYPDVKTAYDIPGEKLMTLGLEWIPRYVQAVYAGSMKEYLSMIYLGVHNEAWLTAAQYGPTEDSRLAGQAMLDWIWADLAVNTHLGQTVPPSTRAKLMLDHSAPMIHPSTHAQWLAWLYWGDMRSKPGSDPLAPVAAALTSRTTSGHMKEDNEGFQTVIVPSISPLLPQEVIRNLGAKNVPLPYMLLQSRAHGAFVGTAALNPYLKRKEKPEAEISRNHLRSAYVARNYSIGAGYFRRDDSGDNEQYMHLLPTAISYRSADLFNTIFVSHPYWYAGEPHGNDDEAAKVFGLDCWLGKSPFEQSVHWENTILHLFDIPETDPYLAAGKQKEAAKWTDSRLAAPMKKVCIYVPESIDETRQTPWGWLLREGDVYIALRPLNVRSATWEKCTNEVQKGHKRLVLEGTLIGLAVEVGDAAEYGSADAFAAKVGAAKVEAPGAAGKRMGYVSSRGIPFSLEFNAESWFPKASVKGVALDFDKWPTCESPYVNCRNSVMNVNDGRAGFSVGWKGGKPVYSSYQVKPGTQPR